MTSISAMPPERRRPLRRRGDGMGCGCGSSRGEDEALQRRARGERGALRGLERPAELTLLGLTLDTGEFAKIIPFETRFPDPILFHLGG